MIVPMNDTDVIDKDYCSKIASRCNTRDEFKTLDVKAYRLACRAGWLVEWFPLRRNLTKELCKVIASKCESRHDLFSVDPSCYQKSRREGWLDEFFPLDITAVRNLTKTVCEDIAKTCHSRTEFRRIDQSAYEKSRKMGWLTEFFPHKNTAGRILTHEFCRSVASKYDDRMSFRLGDPSAYQKSYTNKWLDEFFPNKKNHAAYTFDDCERIALQCNTRTEFKLMNPSAYKVARVNGWLDKFKFIDSTMARSLAKKKYTDDELINAAKLFDSLSDLRKAMPNIHLLLYRRKLVDKCTFLSRNNEVDRNGFVHCVYVYKFPSTMTAYVGRTCEPLHRDKEHHSDVSPVYQYAIAHGIEVPSPEYVYTGLGMADSGQKECEVMSEMRGSGWTLLNSAPGGGMGSLGYGKLSKKKCDEIAKQYTYLITLRKNRPDVYRTASRNGWINDYVWLKRKTHPRSYWTYELCMEEAKQYATVSAFSRCAHMAYQVSKEHGWLCDWFK